SRRPLNRYRHERTPLVTDQEGTASTGGRSNFEKHSHQTLYSMVSGGNPSELRTTGQALQRLREDIDRIATDLEGYVDRVEWKGKGSEAFREWGNHTVRESRKLARHAGTGDQLAAAGQALSEVQRCMPRPDFVSVEHEPMVSR